MFETLDSGGKEKEDCYKFKTPNLCSDTISKTKQKGRKESGTAGTGSPWPLWYPREGMRMACGRWCWFQVSAPSPCAPVFSQIDSFELLYYYDEYLGHSMW